MSEPIALETLARPDLGGEVRLTLEETERGRVVMARLWRRGPDGRPQETRFGISIRPKEIRRWLVALRKADDALVGAWELQEEGQKLTPRERMTRFLADVGANVQATPQPHQAPKRGVRNPGLNPQDFD